MHDALQHAFVRLRAERRQCERARGAALVADRRHARLADRQLQVQRAEAGDDLGRGRPGRREAGSTRRGRSLHGLPVAAERGHEQRYERDDEDREQDGETTHAPFTLQLPAMRMRRPPVGHRGRHGGHRSEPVIWFQPRKRPGSSARVPSKEAVHSQSGGRIGTTRRVASPPSSTRIRIPRWVQLVGLPLLLLLMWVLATRVIHVVFLFVVAALVALLLDPLTRALQRVHLPRGLSVALCTWRFWRCSR